MNGSIEDTSIVKARKTSSSDQSSLSSFGATETTYLGVVNSADDDFMRVVDENEPSLSPPDELFGQWLTTRKKLSDNEVSKVVAHNEAVERVGYEQRFREHVVSDEEAQQAIEDVADRVRDGERIVLVCYCFGGMMCHREIVRDEIERTLDES